jgi:hypothetical protein
MKIIAITLVLFMASGCCIYRDAYKEYGDCQK